MANILPQITHIVVVMFENRSLDNMCGWIYPHQGINPSRFLPAGSPAAYDGLNGTLWNPSNRSFLTAGTSNGNVNNGKVPDPLDWDVTTIFNVLESIGASWNVYADTWITPSLVRIMFPKLWDPLLDFHFHGFDDFEDDCASDNLPQYSFIEPSFLIDPNDHHP